MTNETPNDTIPASDKGNDYPTHFEIRTLDMEAKSQPILFDELPKAIRADLDDLAANIFDPHGGRSFVLGYPMTGKSFFIEQFAANIDRYLEQTDQTELIFIQLNSSDIPLIDSLPGKYDTYISSITSQTGLKEENLCFVTESFEIANNLSIYARKSKIIFELSVYTYNQLLNLEMNGQSKTWMSWPTIDMNFVHCSKSELADLLHASLSEQLSQAYKVNILKKDIHVFIGYCQKKLPDLVSVDDPTKLIVPPGIWAMAIRKLAGALAFASDSDLRHNGKKVFTRVTTRVFDEIRPHFDEFLNMNVDPDGILDGFPKELLEQMGVRVVMQGGADPKEAAVKDINAPVFSDFDTLAERLRKEVIGQDDAVDAVVEGLLVPAAGLNDTTKPIRSMLLLGPTGVGKTKLATTLANELMTEPLHVIRLDMSEYAQANEAVKLFGAPPGYVGHGQGGTLTTAVEKNPNSLILLDEVEKAHPTIWDAFLQVLDAGRMTSGTGNEVDFSRTVIVMTSNLGSKELARRTSGFSASIGATPLAPSKEQENSTILKAVEEFFKPELVNRIDELIVFKTLSIDTARKIIDKEIGIIDQRAKLAGFSLDSPSSDIIEALLQKSNVSKYGAREIQRIVLKHVSSPIARAMLKKEKDAKALSLTLDDNKEISVLES